MKSKILELIRRKGVRELLRENYLLIPLLVLFVISSFGVYTRPAHFGWPRIVGVVAIAVYFAAAFYRYVLRLGGDFQYVEVVGALILTINFLVQLTGGVHSFWFGLYMLLMIAVGINYSLRISLLTVFRIGLLEGFNALATALRTDQAFETERFLLWILMLILVAIVGEASMVMLKRRLGGAEKELETKAQREAEEMRERKKYLPVFAQAVSLDESEHPSSATEPDHESPSLEEALLSHFAKTVGASHVGLFLKDMDNRFMLEWGVGSEGTFEEEAFFVEGQGLLGYCAKNGSPLAGKRVPGASARSWKVDFVYLKSGGDSIRSYMVEPVRNGDEVVGILAADRTERMMKAGGRPEEFSSSELEQMKSLAELLELDWQRSRTARAQHKSNEVLTTFFRIIARLSSTLDVNEVAALLVQESRHLLEYETGAVALINQDRETYSLKSPVGLEFNSNEAIPVTSKTWAIWSMDLAEEALLISDFQRRKGQMPIYAPSEPPLEVGSFLAVPLGPAGRRRGVLILTHSQPGQFSVEGHQLLRLLCQHAAVIVENAITHQMMECLAVTDELTQLPNHRCFQDRLEEEISRARRNKKPLSLLMVDIDHFKKINDTYGHRFGDWVLSQLAGVIERCLRREDFAARYGGEEFALILPETTREGARQTAERLKSEVGRTVLAHDGNTTHVSISGGIATFPRDASTKEQLIEHADKALYVAKKAGRNCIAQFHVIETMQLPIEFSQ